VIATHSVLSADLEALATGRGGPEVIRRLATAQASKRMLRLRAIVDAARSLPPDRAATLHRGYDLLATAQEQDPVTTAKVLMYPSVGAWSALCLQQLRRNEWSAGESGELLFHLAAVAASAGASTGMDFQIEIPTRSGAIFLPTLGQAQFDAEDWMPAAVVRGGSGGAHVVAGRQAIAIPSDVSSDQHGWRGLRRLRSTENGQTLELVLDDLDPFRACYGFPLDGRLSADAVDGWRQRLDGAWSILVRYHPWYASGIQAGLTSLIPLRTGPGGKGISTTSSDAFGACALSFPADAQTLAVTLVHEFQHAKLGALHDLVPLHTAMPDIRYYSPWRDDPRPLHGLLQGAYAYLGVTDLWRTQRSVGAASAFGDFEFVRWREQTLHAVGVIERSGLLTPVGSVLAAGMRTQLEQWNAVPVADMPRAAAEIAMTDHRVSWRLRNLRPDPADTDRLAAVWLASAAAGHIRSRATVRPSDRALSYSHRTELIGLMLRDPARFRRESGYAESSAADIALVRGDLATAARRYGDLLADDPDRTDAWAGLALTEGSTQSILSRLPELACAVYRRIREISATAPDPVGFAAWLAAEESACGGRVTGMEGSQCPSHS
jgi:HEXXH motif-containing protein